LVLTAGIVVDRYADVPIGLSLVAAVLGLVAWVVTRCGPSRGLPLLYLAAALAAIGAAYHHAQHALFADDDVGARASEDLRPARLRGTLDDEPVVVWHPPHGGLQSFAKPDPTVSVLRVSARKQDDEWLPASGRVRLLVMGQFATPLHVGDEVEAVGRLIAPPGPANPGEMDYAAYLANQRIRALLLVQKTRDGVQRLEEGSSWSPAGWLAALRSRGQQALVTAMSDSSAPAPSADPFQDPSRKPGELSGIAAALLLGDGSAMTTEDWQQYIRTGVIHVLAISGQHLVILGGFLWFLLRVIGVRRRNGAWFVAAVLIGYALLAGGRPPVLRAAVMVAVACGSVLLRRPALTANAFALAWIVVAAVNPSDLFDTGCQLSFLAVAVLYWGTGWLNRRPDALEQAIEQSRPAWLRGLRAVGRTVLASYAVTAVVWLAVAPLVAARYHLVSPIALIIGPPTVLLTSIALVAGFLLLLCAVACPLLVPVCALVTRLSLAACSALVGFADRLPVHLYVGDIPEWWLWGFYGGLFGVLWLGTLRLRWRWVMPAGAAWLCVGLIGGAARPVSDEFRCTFLAVGHGGCTVLEMPDGRTLLYDAGALAGPEVTRRQIAPFLWHRGIRRIDEVVLSHADLDHFNGLPAILERFAVGQVSCTPTFRSKSTAGVAAVLEALARRGVPIQIVSAGDRLKYGNVTLDVLHPPADGPYGTENERSLVLLVQHERHSILLTGDLEKAGLARVLGLASPRPAILMAPHHGSRTANTAPLAEWAGAKVVVSCQGPPRGRPGEPYSQRGAIYLGTWPQGAVTVKCGRDGISVETFVTGERIRVR
jgi:competence protein ComEC